MLFEFSDLGRGYFVKMVHSVIRWNGPFHYSLKWHIPLFGRFIWNRWIWCPISNPIRWNPSSISMIGVHFDEYGTRRSCIPYSAISFEIDEYGAQNTTSMNNDHLLNFVCLFVYSLEWLCGPHIRPFQLKSMNMGRADFASHIRWNCSFSLKLYIFDEY